MRETNITSAECNFISAKKWKNGLLAHYFVKEYPDVQLVILHKLK